MILAGDIGGTNARLAYFQPQNGHLRLVSERTFPSREHSELGEIVSQFLDDSGTRPEAACFGIAGPVRNGRVETSNLPWVVEQSRLAKQIHLPATLLINDLEASAWGIGALAAEDLVPLNRVSGPAVGNQACDRAGNGTGRSRVVLGRKPASRFRLRRRTHRLWSAGRFADRVGEVPAGAFRTCELRTHPVRPRPGECLRIPARQRMRQGICGVCRRSQEGRPGRGDFAGGARRNSSLWRRKRWTCGSRFMARKPPIWLSK